MAIKDTDKTYADIKDQRLSDSSFIRMFDIMKDDDDEYFMNIFKTFTIDDTVFNTTTNFDTVGVVQPWWENIAYTHYKDVDLWWMVCLSNNIVNPFEEISEGDIISLLKPQYIPYIHRDMKRIFDL